MPNRQRTPEFNAAQFQVKALRALIAEQEERIANDASQGHRTAHAERLLGEMRNTLGELKTHREKMRGDGATFKSRQPKQRD